MNEKETGFLIVKRKEQEKIYVDVDGISITILFIKAQGKQAIIGVECPKKVLLARTPEMLESMKKSRNATKI